MVMLAVILVIREPLPTGGGRCQKLLAALDRRPVRGHLRGNHHNALAPFGGGHPAGPVRDRPDDRLPGLLTTTAFSAWPASRADALRLLGAALLGGGGGADKAVGVGIAMAGAGLFLDPEACCLLDDGPCIV